VVLSLRSKRVYGSGHELRSLGYIVKDLALGA
jgi:hypothetical protein